MAASLNGGAAFAQRPPSAYEAISDDVAKATVTADEMRSYWGAIWTTLEVDSCVAEAIIFPELVRYSRWQDRMEEAIMTSSYLTQGSKNGPDYSIGMFQMKASFVESLEKRWMRSTQSKETEIYFDTRTESRMARQARIDRLRNPMWQCIYLALFIRMLYADYPELGSQISTEQVRLCAAAYNHGIRWPEREGTGSIEQMYEWSTKNTFFTDFFPTPLSDRYNYSEIALQHYISIKQKR